MPIGIRPAGPEDVDYVRRALFEAVSWNPERIFRRTNSRSRIPARALPRRLGAPRRPRCHRRGGWRGGRAWRAAFSRPTITATATSMTRRPSWRLPCGREGVARASGRSSWLHSRSPRAGGRLLAVEPFGRRRQSGPASPVRAARLRGADRRRGGVRMLQRVSHRPRPARSASAGTRRSPSHAPRHPRRGSPSESRAPRSGRQSQRSRRVELHEADAALVLGGERLEDRLHGPTRPAPRRPEVDDDRVAGVEHLVLECRVGDFVHR